MGFPEKTRLNHPFILLNKTTGFFDGFFLKTPDKTTHYYFYIKTH
jgi:hypothetical protein